MNATPTRLWARHIDAQGSGAMATLVCTRCKTKGPTFSRLAIRELLRLTQEFGEAHKCKPV